MKTLALVFVVIFVFLPIFAQGAEIQSINNWTFVGMGGSPIDSQQTRSFFSQGSQIFCNFGGTFGNGNYAMMQGTWVKYFRETYPIVPDTLKYDAKYFGGLNVGRIFMDVAIQDSFSYYSLAGKELNLQDSGWQYLAWDMTDVKRVLPGRFIKIYLLFAMGAQESCAIGSRIAIDNLRGVTQGVTTIYDYFGDPPASVSETEGIPSGFTLGQNYPNPFNPSTTIKFSILQRGLVNLKVFNLLGQEITTLVNEELETGSYEAKFNASVLPSGTYFYRLQAGSFVETKRMMLLK